MCSRRFKDEDEEEELADAKGALADAVLLRAVARGCLLFLFKLRVSSH